MLFAVGNGMIMRTAGTEEYPWYSYHKTSYTSLSSWR